MRCFKLILKDIKQKTPWEGTKDEVKLGEVQFPIELTLDDQPIKLKKGDQIYYQYGSPAVIDGQDYILVGVNSIVCQK